MKSLTWPNYEGEGASLLSASLLSKHQNFETLKSYISNSVSNAVFELALLYLLQIKGLNNAGETTRGAQHIL